MKEAGDAGLIIVAPIANVVSKDMQYPAAYPEAISVAAFNNGMPVQKDPEVAQWVQFGTDGSLPIRELNGKSDYGSSFASARIAGILASIDARSEEHTSELQSLMRISYAVFCLKKKKNNKENNLLHTNTHYHNQQQPTHLTYVEHMIMKYDS